MTEIQAKSESLIYTLSSLTQKSEAQLVTEALELYQQYLLWKLSAKNIAILTQFFENAL